MLQVSRAWTPIKSTGRADCARSGALASLRGSEPRSDEEGPHSWGPTMYESHFGLRERPFRASPDPSAYYPGTSHERALARLQQGLADDEGLVLLLGEPGTGKTLLCHCLLERLGADAVSAFLTNSHL